MPEKQREAYLTGHKFIKVTMTSEEFKELEDNLWQTADTLRANSDLKSSEYATPVLGMIFLKFADNKYRYTHA